MRSPHFHTDRLILDLNVTITTPKLGHIRLEIVCPYFVTKKTEAKKASLSNFPRVTGECLQNLQNEILELDSRVLSSMLGLVKIRNGEKKIRNGGICKVDFF